MRIDRDYFLKKLISRKHNGRIKIVTGIRRCGKSFLLFTLFKEHLMSEGVDSRHIIEMELDNRLNKELRNPDRCLDYVTRLIDEQGQFYLLIDEVQYMSEFEDVLNSFLHIKNLDIYVTGSNSKFLSKDVITEFRGRGDEVHIGPLSFSEYCQAFPDNDWSENWNQYYTFGGLPFVATLEDDEEKADYLKTLFSEIYSKDISERYGIRNESAMEHLLDIISSAIGSLTNPKKLENTFRSIGKDSLTEDTIKKYLDCFCDAFLIEKAERYDVKGKNYISTPQKYYFTDVGLRNARLNYRQQEETHIMENVIYNELRARGFGVDVGVIGFNEKNAVGKYERRQAEIDFVANKGSQRYYVQSAFSIPDSEKMVQEIRPLLRIDDSFKKIVIVKDNIKLKRDDNGIVTMGLKQFLLDPHSLEL